MKIRIFLFLTLLFFTAACSPAEPDVLVLSEAEAWKRIELDQGQIFQVSLEGNLTTGYNWILAPQEPALFELQGEPEFKSGSDLMGAPGIITLTFKAVAPGQTVLHLDYRRPWEETIPPTKTFEVIIVVR